MSNDFGTPATSSKAMVIAGWVLSVLPCLMLTMSALSKFTQPKEAVEGFEHLGWPLSVAIALGVVELGSTIIYLIPATSILGAILLTGYLGGAISAHVRLEEAFWIPLVLGVVIWLGIYLREARLRQLIPLRR
jgi:hypothetical protein